MKRGWELFVCGLMYLMVTTTASRADAIDDLQPVVRLRADDLNGTYTNGERISSWTDIGTHNPAKASSLVFQYQQITYPDALLTNQRPKLIKGVMKGHSVVRFDANDYTWMVAGRNVGELQIIQNQVWNQTGQTMVAIFSMAAGDVNSALIHLYVQNDAFGIDRAMGIGGLNLPNSFPPPLRGTAGNLIASDDRQNGGSALLDTGYAVPSETPMWVTFTALDGTNLSVYANGVLKGSQARTGGYGGTKPTAITIGGREWQGGTHLMADWLSGDIAEVIIFNRVLNATDRSIVDAFALETYIPHTALMIFK